MTFTIYDSTSVYAPINLLYRGDIDFQIWQILMIANNSF